MRYAPDFPLSDGVPRDQFALGKRAKRLPSCYVVRRHERGQLDGGIPRMRPMREAIVGRVIEGQLLSRYIDQTRFRTVGHRMPGMTADATRYHQIRLFVEDVPAS